MDIPDYQTLMLPVLTVAAEDETLTDFVHSLKRRSSNEYPDFDPMARLVRDCGKHIGASKDLILVAMGGGSMARRNAHP